MRTGSAALGVRGLHLVGRARERAQAKAPAHDAYSTIAEGFWPSPAAFRRKVGWVREAAGDRFEHLELEVQAYFLAVTQDRDSTAAAVGNAFNLSAAEVLEVPLVLIGTVDQLADELQRRRETYGISYLTVGADVMESFAPVVERLSGA